MSGRGQLAMEGRRESALLEQPSVRHFADTLGQFCRETSWVRTSVASLDRFASLTGNLDLEALLERARHDPAVAQNALAAFATALSAYTRVQIAGLAMGPKLWFTLNGVAVAWRPLPGQDWTPDLMHNTTTTDRFILLALVGSGLHRSELLRVRIGDVGSLDGEGRLVHDLKADPLAIRFIDARTRREHITFITERAREALALDLAARARAGAVLDLRAPLVATATGAPATQHTVARAARLNAALIEAGNNVNVEMCKKTGAFFRAWGMPGARFEAAEKLRVENARAEEAV
jgi:integrase